MNLIPNYTDKALIANLCEINNVKLPDHMRSMSLNQPLAILSHPDFGVFRDLNITHSSVKPPPSSPKPTQSSVVDGRNSLTTPRGRQEGTSLSHPSSCVEGDTPQASQSSAVYSSDGSRELPREPSLAVATLVSIPLHHAIPLALLVLPRHNGGHCCETIGFVIPHLVGIAVTIILCGSCSPLPPAIIGCHGN
ncbi:hypothetical protein Nepgr_028544 [Nepenthes gracilis]|uniref:Uncharacterized protein n=1 Tax=Nepenthes gracilis TaxID=150966 RepID=A0AAD3Y4N2_NEPGR|nr:hypothetical protein Nepgr_028544 [Nepenthes gracilis]